MHRKLQNRLVNGIVIVAGRTSTPLPSKYVASVIRAQHGTSSALVLYLRVAPSVVDRINEYRNIPCGRNLRYSNTQYQHGCLTFYRRLAWTLDVTIAVFHQYVTAASIANYHLSPHHPRAQYRRRSLPPSSGSISHQGYLHAPSYQLVCIYHNVLPLATCRTRKKRRYSGITMTSIQ